MLPFETVHLTMFSLWGVTSSSLPSAGFASHRNHGSLYSRGLSTSDQPSRWQCIPISLSHRRTFGTRQVAKSPPELSMTPPPQDNDDNHATLCPYLLFTYLPRSSHDLFTFSLEIADEVTSRLTVGPTLRAIDNSPGMGRIPC